MGRNANLLQAFVILTLFIECFFGYAMCETPLVSTVSLDGFPIMRYPRAPPAKRFKGSELP